MSKKKELSATSFVRLNGEYIDLSSLSRDIKNDICTEISIKALGKLNEGYIFEKCRNAKKGRLKTKS